MQFYLFIYLFFLHSQVEILIMTSKLELVSYKIFLDCFSFNFTIMDIKHGFHYYWLNIYLGFKTKDRGLPKRNDVAELIFLFNEDWSLIICTLFSNKLFLLALPKTPKSLKFSECKVGTKYNDVITHSTNLRRCFHFD